ncbi:hypothetical protein AQUCO_00500489v1 [Aquilegia coerulea]|uniref:Uncharacterized protein n=1 Tax=Aquilegia coerulea TaxID=218851 RepID=A0A2G5ES60_AQUCA|nr:hypothetical protein AQUCO_00500489v1 [Aquilegia coerulea]
MCSINQGKVELVSHQMDSTGDLNKTLFTSKYQPYQEKAFVAKCGLFVCTVDCDEQPHSFLAQKERNMRCSVTHLFWQKIEVTVKWEQQRKSRRPTKHSNSEWLIFLMNYELQLLLTPKHFAIQHLNTKDKFIKYLWTVIHYN